MEIRTGYHEFISRPDRAKSREYDYGVIWYEFRDGKVAKSPAWRVSWIEKTGELYGVELDNAGSPKRRYVVLGVFKSKREVDEFMNGWTSEPKMVGPLVNRYWSIANLLM